MARRKSRQKNNEQQMILMEEEQPDFEWGTHQVPVGPGSIFNDPSISKQVCAVYQYRNMRSSWKTGMTHAVSNSEVAKALGINISEVIRNQKILEEQGWMDFSHWSTPKNPGEQKTKIYKIVHHKPHDGLEEDQDPISYDRDGQPKKCAVTNKVVRMLERGKIKWRDYYHFLAKKINSDWSTGEMKATVGDLLTRCRTSWKKLKESMERLTRVGLIKKIGSFLYELLPLPSCPKKERQINAGGRLRYKGGFYYSLTGEWRLNKETRQVEKKFMGYWVDSDLVELRNVNKSIHNDFHDILEPLIDLMDFRQALEDI